MNRACLNIHKLRQNYTPSVLSSVSTTTVYEIPRQDVSKALQTRNYLAVMRGNGHLHPRHHLHSKHNIHVPMTKRTFPERN